MLQKATRWYSAFLFKCTTSFLATAGYLALEEVYFLISFYSPVILNPTSFSTEGALCYELYVKLIIYVAVPDGT